MDKAKEAAASAVNSAQAGIAKARDDKAVAAEAAAVATANAPRPILELVSHIEGRNAKVRLWPDRIEWERPRGVSGAKITAGVMTGGLSMLATGVKGGKDEHDLVFIKNVTNVSSKKDGFTNYLVEVQTAAGGAVNSVAFRVNKDEAATFRAAILAAMNDLDAKPSATVIVQQAESAPAAPAAPDAGAQLQQLAALRDAGVLTEDEFAAKKAEVLARF